MRIAIATAEECTDLRQLIVSVAGYQIAWIAYNGNDAVRRCRSANPDLLIMSLALPGLDSIAAIKQIMHDSPCPILVIASSLDTNVSQVFAAMGQGAKDVINYPLQGDGIEAQQSRQALLKKVRNLAMLHGKSTPAYPDAVIDKYTADSSRYRTQVGLEEKVYFIPKLIVIGSSTGGPGALAKILNHFPADLNAAVVIIQHVDKEFSGDLAIWLNGQTKLAVQLAEAGKQPKPGRVYVASSNDHLIITPGLKFAYTADPKTTHYRPSVDVFFHSMAKYWSRNETAVLLTGMGRDGALGLSELKNKGWYTIAQDEASCVVYGMPKAAKEIGAALEILALDNIAPAILKRLGR